MVYVFTIIKDISALSMLSQFRTDGTCKFVEYAQLGPISVGDISFLAHPEITMGAMSASHRIPW